MSKLVVILLLLASVSACGKAKEEPEESYINFWSLKIGTWIDDPIKTIQELGFPIVYQVDSDGRGFERYVGYLVRPRDSTRLHMEMGVVCEGVESKRRCRINGVGAHLKGEGQTRFTLSQALENTTLARNKDDVVREGVQDNFYSCVRIEGRKGHHIFSIYSPDISTATQGIWFRYEKPKSHGLICKNINKRLRSQPIENPSLF